MESVNVHEAKTNLSRLLEYVASGGEVTIAKAGKPVARLVPFETSTPKRRFGVARGKIRIPDDFDAPLPEEILRAFEGE